MRVGEKIKELRQEKGLSQAQLGKQIGASQKAVDYWERGINEPKVSYVIALVRFFELSYDDFLQNLIFPTNNNPPLPRYGKGDLLILPKFQTHTRRGNALTHANTAR